MPSTQENIDALERRIEDLMAEAQAILDGAAGADRSLLPDEQARVDEIMGPPGSEGEGLVAELEASRLRWQAYQSRQNQLMQRVDSRRQNDLRLAMGSRAGGDGAAQIGTPAENVFALGATRPVVVPQACKAHRPIKYFKSEQEAYAAGRWFLAAIFRHEASITWCEEHGIPVKLQQEIGTPAKGGYLVPAELERAVIDIREQYGVFRRDARIYGMGAETRDVPKVADGLVATPVGERQAIGEDDKDWGQVNLVARKWGVLTRISSEIQEDAIIDMASDIARDMGRAFAMAEDGAGFNGDGTGTYHQITGIKNALLAGATYTATGKQAFSTLEPIDFETMIGMLPNILGADPKWYIHKTAHSQSMLRILQASGGNTIQTLEQGAAIQRGDADFFFMGYAGRFLNVGVTVADQGASVKGAVYFGDLSMGAAFGDRRGVTVRMSEHAAFDTDEVLVRGLERFDIQIHETGDANKSGAIAQLEFGA